MRTKEEELIYLNQKKKIQEKKKKNSLDFDGTMVGGNWHYSFKESSYVPIADRAGLIVNGILDSNILPNEEYIANIDSMWQYARKLLQHHDTSFKNPVGLKTLLALYSNKEIVLPSLLFLDIPMQSMRLYLISDFYQRKLLK